jgi:hypothetical protein
MLLHTRSAADLTMAIDASVSELGLRCSFEITFMCESFTILGEGLESGAKS